MTSNERSDATRNAVLDVVCQHLWHEDEGLLRIADICHETNLSSSVIYNYFRSRQGLIDTAYLEIYRDLSADLTSVLKGLMTGAASTREIIDRLREELADPDRQIAWQRRRHMRIRIATAAVARTAMRAEFALIQDSYLANLAELFADLQRLHVVGDLLTPHQQATMFDGCLIIRSLSDISLMPIDDEDWLSMVSTILGTSATMPDN